ncbi:hypothetical protein Q31a_62080 [Aureliella helgolandensis]|uniref:DUF1559 domain-containing protein n=1 Tax=Aureliella helgolandensis TaxID=2527968 RepID=A0A518GGT7_9BACT|nr:hypothetical protein Q31a_62080 [Aureliella helgolandensis]
MILPYIEQGPLCNQIDFGYRWDNDNGGTVNNSVVARARISSFACPSDAGSDANDTANMSPISYGFSAGPGSDWSLGGSKAGLASFGQVPKIGAITDGTSNSIAMSELRIGLNKGEWQTGAGTTRDPSYGVTGIPRVQWANNTAGRNWTSTPGHVAQLRTAYDG